MVNFENGTLVKGAYVVIDGVEHEVHMPKYSGNTPLSAEILNKMQIELLNLIFPTGSTYITQTDTNPNSILGFGTWERLKGKLCLGLDEDDTNLNVIGKTGGEKVHKLTIEEMPSHSFTVNAQSVQGAGGGSDWYLQYTGSNQNLTTTSLGDGQAHNNMPPYQVVGYMWIRTD